MSKLGWDRIEIILSPDASAAIREAVRRAHVWVAFSPANRQTVESLWMSALRDRISLTIPDGEEAQLNDLARLVEAAIEHHGAVREIAVVGDVDVAFAGASLAAVGYRLDQTKGGILEFRREGG